MIISVLDNILNIIWGMPTVILIIWAGIYFTAKMRLPQLTSFKNMLRSAKKYFFSKDEKSKKPFEAISTALAATVGTGSVTGVATALTIGGAGAVFWLWVSAFLGMAVAYAEGVLSIKYRNGKKGGIMYAIRDGMGEHFTAVLYAALTVLTSFGMGSMAQANSAAGALKAEFNIPPHICGLTALFIAAICCFCKKDLTGKLCSVFLPLLSLAYIGVMVGVIAVNASRLPEAFSLIIRSAFGIRPIMGGVCAIGVKEAIKTGFKRGIFSNEAGLGTTAAIHAECGCDDPHEQGLMNMLEVIIDTFIICTLTALSILASGGLDTGCDGAELVTASCATAFGSASGKIVALSIAGFAFATIMGWSKIGISAAEYIFRSEKSVGVTICKLMFTFCSFLGAVMSLDIVWKLSDIFNGLMILPCMAALIFLRREIVGCYILPVEPKPLTPRSLSGSSSASSTSGNITGAATNCAKRSPGSKV